MILTSAAIALLCFVLSLFAIVIVNIFKNERSGGEAMIIELGRQAKISFVVWSLCFLFFAVMFVLLLNKNYAVPAAADFAYGIMVYLIFSFIYLIIYNFASRSISATLLEIIDDSPGDKLTSDEVKKIYGIENKYQTELGWMLDSGLLVKSRDHYKNTPMGSLGAKTAILVKKILKLGPGG